MFARVTALLAVSLSTAAAAAPPAPVTPRPPTQRWVVDFADAQCVAYRNYGTKENPILLVLKAAPMGSIMQLSVLRPGTGSETAVQLDGKIAVDGREAIPASMLSFGIPKEKLRVFRVNLPRGQFDQIRTAKAISLKTSRVEEAFELRQMESLLTVMQDCVGNLKQVWNVTEAVSDQQSEDRQPHPLLSKSASGSLARIFSAADYPDDAFAKQQQGTATVAILVNEAGKVADCTVIETSGVAALDAQSCAIIQERAQFKPAVGKDGKPAKDAWCQRITWRIR